MPRDGGGVLLHRRQLLLAAGTVATGAPVPGRSSAIFLHVARIGFDGAPLPTSGCTAPRAVLLHQAGRRFVRPVAE